MSRWIRGGAVVASTAVVLSGMAMGGAAQAAMTPDPAAPRLGQLTADLGFYEDSLVFKAPNTRTLSMFRVQVRDGGISDGKPTLVNPWTAGKKPKIEVRMVSTLCQVNPPKPTVKKAGSFTFKKTAIQKADFRRAVGNDGWIYGVRYKVPNRFMRGYLVGKDTSLQVRVRTTPAGSTKAVKSKWRQFDTINDCYSG